MRLPKSWKTIAPGHYLHLETGVEIIRATKTCWGIKTPTTWTSDRFGIRHTSKPAGTARTLGDACVIAVDTCIPQIRAEIAAAWDDAHFHETGHPNEWPEQLATTDVVAARRAAVTATGTATARTATPGQPVIHIETGARGRFDGTQNYDLPLHGLTGLIAAVTFDGSGIGPQAVQPDDVVVLPDPLDEIDPVTRMTFRTLAAYREYSDAVLPLLYRRTDCDRIDAEHDARPELVDDGSRTEAWFRQAAAARRAFAEKVDAMVAALRLGDRVRLADDETGTVWSVEDIHDGSDGWVWLSLVRTGDDGQKIGSGCRARAVDLVEPATDDEHQAFVIARRVQALDWAQTAYASAGYVLRRALEDGKPGTWEREQQSKAFVDLLRAELALHIARGQAPGVVRIVTIEYTADDGGRWHLDYEESAKALPGETESDQAMRVAVDHGLTHKLVPSRVRVYTDPLSPEPTAEWSNLTDPCVPGTHVVRPERITSGPDRGDGSTVDVARCANCWHPTWRLVAAAGEASPWQLAGEPLPGLPEGLSPGLSGTQTQTAQTAVGDRLGRSVSGLSEGLSTGLRTPVSIAYRVQTQTPHGWRVVQTGHTPPTYRPVCADLAVVADTVLSNARSVLGLDPKQTLPPVLVQTWHWPSGLSAAQTRTR